MKKSTIEEKSAGGIVFRNLRKTEYRNQILDLSNFEFLIGKHSGYHKWVLPKGLVERGESEREAATREVEEEVGVKAKIIGSDPIKSIEYWYYAEFGETKGKDAKGEASTRRVKKYQEDPDFAKASTGKGAKKTRVHKKVIFYLMELAQDLGSAGWEMEERRWASYEEAKKLLDFETEREVLESARKALVV